MDEEPAVNISGGDDGGGSPTRFPAHDGETHAERVVDQLGELYWQKTYGGQDAFACLVRTILSQNTSDKASKPAYDALIARYGAGDESADTERGRAAPPPDLVTALADASQDDLADTIAAAGLYNQKAATLIRLATRIIDDYGTQEEFNAFVQDGDPAEVRDVLLDMKGVGPKTADCVLLFAGGRDGVFPVDTHIHRIARRMGLAPPSADHEVVRDYLEAAVPAEKCGFGHTAMIQFGREYCSARTPRCLESPDACPLVDACAQVGVSPASGDVVDPATADSADE